MIFIFINFFRSESIGSTEKFEALEPVIAKTRLHDPRLNHQPRFSPNTHTLYKSFKTAHFIHRGTARRTVYGSKDKSSEGARLKKRDKDLKKSQSNEDNNDAFEKLNKLKVKFAKIKEDKLSESKSDDNLHMNSVDEDNSYLKMWSKKQPWTDDEGTQEMEVNGVPSSPSKENSLGIIKPRPRSASTGGMPECHLFTSQPTPIDMGLCQDLPLPEAPMTPDGEVVVTLQVPEYPSVRREVNKNKKHSEGSPPRVVPSASASPSPSPPTIELLPEQKPSSGKPSKKSAKPGGNRELDSEQLCADIAACDTLFLDIGAKETPELIAARNLKVKVKKKKDTDKPKKTKNNNDNEFNPDEKVDEENNKVTNTLENTKDPSQPEVKVKKKIKIVIGKKPKTRLKKKLRESRVESSP